MVGGIVPVNGHVSAMDVKPRDLINSRPIIISQRLMLRSTTCIDLLIDLLACSSGNLKLVAILVVALFTIVWLSWYDEHHTLKYYLSQYLP